MLFKCLNKFCHITFNKQNYFYFVVPTTVISLYCLEKKYSFTKKFITNFLLDILNSKEVKGAGIDLLEILFKDKIVMKTIVISLKEIFTKNKSFESDLKVFIKIWILKVIKDKEFLKLTKTKLIEVLKSREVINETELYLKSIVDQEEVKQTTAKFFKEIFLSELVLTDLCGLFERCAKSAVRSNQIKSSGAELVHEILSDIEFKRKLFLMTLKL